MFRRIAGLAALIALTACSESPMGLSEGPSAPSNVSSVEITGSDEGTDSLTLQALGDTVRLHVTAFDADGNELSLEGREVAWASSDTTVINISEDGGAFLIPDQIWLDVNDGSVRFLNGAPETTGPLPATLTVAVDGVEANREFVQVSPVWAVNVSPDGSCTLAPGTYEDPYSDEVLVWESPVEKDATIEARDYWGRVEPLEVGDAQWTSSDESIATVEADPTDPRAATVYITDAGFVDIEGTVDGITDVYPIESSDEIDWNPDGSGSGKVACTTGPGS